MVQQQEYGQSMVVVGGGTFARSTQFSVPDRGERDGLSVGWGTMSIKTERPGVTT